MATWPKESLGDSTLIWVQLPRFSCWIDITLYDKDNDNIVDDTSLQVPHSSPHIPKVEDIMELRQFYKNILSCLHSVLPEKKVWMKIESDCKKDKVMISGIGNTNFEVDEGKQNLGTCGEKTSDPQEL